MGLQVWLPLNKDTKNYGLSNVTVTNNGATLANNGAFDKCYSFSSNNLYGNLSTINDMTQISCCCWVYLTNLNGAQYFFHFGGQASYPCKISLSYEGSIRSIINGTEYNSSLTLSTNTWYHVAVVWDGLQVKWYLNGKERNSKNTSGSFTASTYFAIGARTHNYGASFLYPLINGGKLNDVRLYDHCLMPEDVKHIYNCKMMEICASSYNGGFFYDNSGLLINDLVSTAITYSGNSMYFNGTTSIIKTPSQGLSISGGTLSVWFFPPTKPSVSNVIYLDATSKMSIGLYNNGTQIITSCGGQYSGKYSAANVVYGSWNHIVAVYSTAKTVTCFVLNGNTLTTSEQDYWTENSTKLFIGGRETYSTPFLGYISKVTVYRNQLTEAEAKQLYAIGPQNKILPDEYIRLEYIQSTGIQYINTEYVPNNTSGIYLKAYCTTQGDNYQAIGCRQNTGDSRWWINFSTTLEFSWNIWNATITGYTNNWVIIEHNYLNSRSAKVNGKAQSVNYPTLVSITQKAYLFNANNQGNPGTGFKGRISNARITEGNVIVRDFIPAKRKSDSVIGMYDLVSNTFFTNAGTGTFTAGPAI